MDNLAGISKGVNRATNSHPTLAAMEAKASPKFIPNSSMACLSSNMVDNPCINSNSLINSRANTECSQVSLKLSNLPGEPPRPQTGKFITTIKLHRKHSGNVQQECPERLIGQ
mmetsp:Transcript_40456/g.86168  ORF Transcript_40456/g.86168 Transcript_40456/m.86168 type:complete len:113 (-) Transcript_40456:528-866(-)